MIRMSDFVIREALIPQLSANTKEGVIREMVESLRTTGHLKSSEAENIVKAVMKREQLGSTGIGHGVAIPHAKHESVERLIGTVAVSTGGVPFDSLDKEPVFILVMLISPPDRPGEHLRALEKVSGALRKDTFCKALRTSTTREAIWELLSELEHG